MSVIQEVTRVLNINVRPPLNWTHAVAGTSIDTLYQYSAGDHGQTSNKIYIVILIIEP